MSSVDPEVKQIKPRESQGASGHEGGRVQVDLADERLRPLTRYPKRVEAIIALLLVLALLCFAGLGGAYWHTAPNEVLGGFLAGGFACMGAAFIMWGRYLLPKGPFEEERHPMVSEPADVVEAEYAVLGRARVAFGRRGFLAKLLGAASGVFGIVALFPLLRSLGPNPGRALFHTDWRKGSRVVDAFGRPIKVSDIDVGGFITVFPEGHVGSFVSQTLLIRAASTPITTRPGRENWSPAGYLAYSKVCTHAGCPISLYQQDTEQLLCPCHQSLFNILDGAEPVFGPAPRPLPQLPLYVDEDGYLRAQSDYNEPIGPGFWNFGR
jgi:ubiquinol-cytochrome c reductase iron-sulfur subunit